MTLPMETAMNSESALEGFRLSPQQLRVWLLQQGVAAGQALPYRATATVQMDGPLDHAALAAALKALCERHEILRTTFQCLPGMTIPLQVIGEAAEVVVDSVQRLSMNGQHTTVDATQAQAQSAHRPLLHVRLHQESPQRHRLQLELPALCTDAAGLTILVHDLSQAYAAQRGAATVEADTEPMQYADFAEWQLDLLNSEDAAAGLAHWQQTELSAARTASLPCARLQSTELAESQAFHPARLPIALDAALAEELIHGAARHQIAPATMLLAAWQILLWRLTEQTNSVVAVAYDGRNYAELQGGIGLYARHLPLAVPLTAHHTLVDVLRELQAVAEQAAAWQECFSWEAMGLMNAEESTVASLPFAFEATSSPAPVAAADVTFTMISADACCEQFQLKLHCAERADGLALQLLHDANIYSGEEVARVADQYGTLLRNLLHAPDLPIAAHSLLSEAARAELFTTLNTTAEDFGPPQLVHQLFEAQAAQHPNTVAACCDGRQLTYRELNDRANRLAASLQAQGVGSSPGRDTLVALDLDRSLDLLVAMLATLKAGGAYLPLDPHLPAERRATVLADAEPTVLLTAVEDCEHPPGFTGYQSPEIDPRSLAYVLYTSGSTGQPKGVGVTHANLVNYVQAIGQRLALAAAATYATVTTFAADLGNSAIFPALCSGGTLHIIRQERASDPNALADYFQQHPVDVLKIVPSHLAALLSSERASALLPRQRLLIGGEALRPDLVARVQALNPACAIINHYGPTETTVGVLTHPLPSPTEPSDPADSVSGSVSGSVRGETVPIGRPLANTHAYILDDALQPVPVWTPGELYIGGAQVSRGYLHRPANTAERFVPDPFSGVAGARLYRTGDLARVLPTGAIEFLGRLDHQIKIRGFRIELGEIEAALRSHAAVSAAVVIGQPTAAGEMRLIAYVAVGEDPPDLPADLPAQLQARLPDYMIPSALVPLAELPLTPNGKLDRRALPDPTMMQSDADEELALPRTQIEELVAGIWREVLGVDRVGLHDDFFALGGHSLMITRVAARLAATFEVELPFQLLFTRRTVAELVQAVAAALSGEASEEALPLVPVARTEQMPLSFAQQRLWFFDQLHPHSAVFNIPGALRLSGPLNVAALESTLSTIVQRHEILRTRFLTTAEGAAQSIQPPQPVTLPVNDLTHLPTAAQQAEVHQLITRDAQQPFDLARGPLLRLGLIQLADEEHIFYFTMHHIISDAWSMDLLVQEIAALYTASVTDTAAAVPELALQYADFAHWQRTWLQGDPLEQHLAYWRRQLANSPDGVTLPPDHRRPQEQEHQGRRASIDLPPELSEALRALSQREGTTLFMTLLTGFQLLVYHHTAQEDLVIGTNSANRSHAQTAGLIGFFVNQLVLRTNLKGNPTVRELLARVRTTALGAYAHQDLPFEKLVEELQPNRDLSRSLLFQMKFELQEGVSKELSLPQLTLEPVTWEHTIVRHDLHLFVRQNPASEGGAGLQATMLYNADLYEAQTIERWLAEYSFVLQSLVNEPTAQLADIHALLGAHRRTQQAETEATLAAASRQKLRRRQRQPV